jgi:hypothetical protein
MKIHEHGAFLEIECIGFGEASTPAADDVQLQVTVRIAGYAAADQSWVVRSHMERFLHQLRVLEQKRHGHAMLASPAPEDLQLEFYSIDSAGHMAVRGHVGWTDPNRFLQQLRFGFAFEPDKLPGILEYFEALVRK